MTRQQSFGAISDGFREYWKTSGRQFHGGMCAKSRRKTRRPFDPKRPVHLVMRSSRAKGSLSMAHPKFANKIDRLVHDRAKIYGVRLYKYSNNGNHLHMVLKAPDRRGFQRFLRVVAGLIPRLITKAARGRKTGKFWDALAFTRLAHWGQDFRRVSAYVVQNLFESAGLVPYKLRKFTAGYAGPAG